jgi:RHS repeat-associated protein
MNIRANAYYRLNGASAGTPSNPASELLAALAGSIQGVTGGKFGMQQVQSSGVLGPGISDLLQRQTDQSTGSTRPKAFLNWVLLDEQFKIVNTSTGFEPVGADGEFKTFVKTGLPISQNGYLYVYTSNESPVDVFFDNLQVTHVRGPLLEETHYYPFGLIMAGISSKSFQSSSPDCGCPGNKKGFNGNEIQNKEFSDGSGLEMYDFNARTYDQQIGRFIQIDPLSEEGDQESLTPYQFSGNNPSTFNDPDGKCPWCIGFIIGAAVDYATQVTGNLIQGKSLSQSLIQVDGKQILISGAAGALTSGASVFVPKNLVGKVAKEVATTTVDVVESVAKQYNEGSKEGKGFIESVSLKQTASDVVANKVGGKIMDNVNANGIKTAEQKLDRVQRVAANDATSSGRANAVKTAETNVVLANGSKQAASGAAGNTLQATSNTLILTPSTSRNFYRNVSTPAVDNTYVRKPLIRL